MRLLAYLLILTFEILYYSCFVYYSKRKGSFIKYLIMFTCITLIGIIINTNTVYSYLALVTMIMIGLKYYIRTKVSLFDVLMVFIMLLIKFILELPIYIIFFNTLGIFTTGLIYGFFKMLFIFLFKDKFSIIYNKLYKLWKNNNFYIRYIFTTFMFMYVIVSCIFILLYYL